MAKIVVDEDCIDIRASLLERMMLAEKSRRLPLSHVRSVNAHPRLLDMMVHWADHERVWLGGVSSYEGHMIPSTRNPRSTLVIELDSEDEPQIFVEVDGDLPENVAARIARAIGSEPPPPPSPSHAPPAYQVPAVSRVALEIARAQQRDEEEEDEEEELLARQRRDPLGQGSLLPPPSQEAQQVARQRRADPHALLGGGLLGVGSLALASGCMFVVSAALPAALVMLAGLASASIGGVVLARHRRTQP